MDRNKVIKFALSPNLDETRRVIRTTIYLAGIAESRLFRGGAITRYPLKIFTAYYYGFEDAQRAGHTLQEDNPKYIEPWNASITELLAASSNDTLLHPIVLHNGLAKDFCDRYPRLDFVEVPFGGDPSDGWRRKLSVYDERWLLWLEYLENNPMADDALVLHTDGSDVTVARDPGVFMSFTSDRYDLWVGDEAADSTFFAYTDYS